MSVELAAAMIRTLPRGGDRLFNPWQDRCADDLPCNGPDEKLKRLAAHLDCRPRVILCGEAAGWQGKRHSGLAFTSERLLIEGAIPRVGRAEGRLTRRRLPFSEPSATIVWSALYDNRIQEETVLWNALPLHPMVDGDSQSNRTPTDDELQIGVPALEMLLNAFDGARIVAVGRKAQRLLDHIGFGDYLSIRHPANGGATEFRRGLAGVVATL